MFIVIMEDAEEESIELMMEDRPNDTDEGRDGDFDDEEEEEGDDE